MSQRQTPHLTFDRNPFLDALHAFLSTGPRWRRWRGWINILAVVALAVLGLLVWRGWFGHPANPAMRVQTVALGNTPLSAVVNARTGRAFVTTSDASGGISTNGQLFVLDVRTGTILRHFPIGTGPLALDDRHGRIFVTTYSTTYSPPSGTGAVAVFDARSGRVFVANQDSDTVSMLDGTSGRVLRTIGVGHKPGTVIVDAARSRVLVVNYGDGTVSTIDARRGALLRTVAIGANPAAAALNARAGRLIVAVRGPVDRAGNPIGAGHAVVLDTRSGRVLRSLPVGVDPQVVAVDERSGRGLVLNAGGTVVALTRDPWAWIPGKVRRLLPFIPSPPQRTQTTHGSVSLIDAR